jgi:hypothetical protein
MDVLLRNQSRRVTDIIHGSIDHRLAIHFDTHLFRARQFCSHGD